MGSPATSPMAKILGSWVRRWLSVSIHPRPSTFTFVFSRPIPALRGFRPTATRTLSNRRSFGSARSRPLRSTPISLPKSETRVTLVLRRISWKRVMQATFQLGHQVAIGSVEQVWGGFHNRYTTTQSSIHRAQFQSDISTAHDQEGIRNIGNTQSSCGVQNSRGVGGKSRNRSPEPNRWPR